MALDRVSLELGDKNKLEEAFPTMSILMSNKYKAYVNNPTDEKIASTAGGLFKAKPLRYSKGQILFNVPPTSPSAMYYIEPGAESNVPTHLKF